MLSLELSQVGFGVQQRPDGAMIVGFQDPESKILITAPFDPASWDKFVIAVNDADRARQKAPRLETVPAGALAALRQNGRQNGRVQ